MYCGNNANNPSLTNGTKVLGTRYGCLKKGKIFGYAQPVDPDFLVPYQPIDTTKKYCGNNDILPDGYDRFGNIYECYLKGVGVGKKLKADEHVNNQPPPQFSFGNSIKNDKNDKNKYILYLAFIVFIVKFFILYYTKPKIILDKDKENKYKINWVKFICFYLFLCTIISCVLYFLCFDY